MAEAAKNASRIFANAPTKQKDHALAAMALSLREATAAICHANSEDVAAAKEAGLSSAFIDRLTLDVARVNDMANAVDSIRLLDDPIGEVTSVARRPNGLEVRKVRAPLGVILMVYESRPNVTSDAAALCLKSGNAAILRGGSESFRTTRAVGNALHAGLVAAGLPPAGISLVPTTDRDSLKELLSLSGTIDLCIPRGGEGLIRFVTDHSKIPVIQHYKGVCHVYVHEDADVDMALNIVVNAKTSRPGVCNAAECLLVDRQIAPKFLPKVATALVSRGVELRACPTSFLLLQQASIAVTPAQELDFGCEFLDLILAVRVVDDINAAVAHIAKYGSLHTEAVVTNNLAAARRFSSEVIASAVIVNASTRFNDGGELGLGAEIGISTSRLHAFGPMGLRELTCQKYILEGSGQVR